MKNIDWDISPDTRPQSISEMALYPSLKNILLQWEKDKFLKHCIMDGSFGTGKTTSARILARLVDVDFVEHDCNTNGSKQELLELTKRLITTNVFSPKGTRVLILDEFHDINHQAQNVFKKFMEDYAHKCKVIICVNDYSNISGAIKDRCVRLNFDVAKENAKQTDILMMEHQDFKNKEEWVKELERCADIVAKKLGVKVSQKMKDEVRKDSSRLVSVRRYVSKLQMLYESSKK